MIYSDDKDIENYAKRFKIRVLEFVTYSSRWRKKKRLWNVFGQQHLLNLMENAEQFAAEMKRDEQSEKQSEEGHELEAVRHIRPR